MKGGEGTARWRGKGVVGSAITMGWFAPIREAQMFSLIKLFLASSSISLHRVIAS